MVPRVSTGVGRTLRLHCRIAGPDLRPRSDGSEATSLTPTMSLITSVTPLAGVCQPERYTREPCMAASAVPVSRSPGVRIDLTFTPLRRTVAHCHGRPTSAPRSGDLLP